MRLVRRLFVKNESIPLCPNLTGAKCSKATMVATSIHATAALYIHMVCTPPHPHGVAIHCVGLACSFCTTQRWGLTRSALWHARLPHQIQYWNTRMVLTPSPHGELHPMQLRLTPSAPFGPKSRATARSFQELPALGRERCHHLTLHLGGSFNHTRAFPIRAGKPRNCAGAFKCSVQIESSTDGDGPESSTSGR